MPYVGMSVIGLQVMGRNARRSRRRDDEAEAAAKDEAASLTR